MNEGRVLEREMMKQAQKILNKNILKDRQIKKM